MIARVSPGGIGAEVGLEPDDRLVSINGHVLRDVIDYQFYAAEEELVLVVERERQRYRLEIERGYDEDLGLSFVEPLFDGLVECNNHCPFCFVAQMPRGLRKSLYIRDDDYRLSFLSGSFVTLTNLSLDDWQRIAEQRLSPLFVSIHATEPEVRRACLGNREAGDIVSQIRRLGQMGIQVHGQIVIVPGLNDGVHLARSIGDCAALWPTMQSLALVPVGLTRFHRGKARTLTSAEAHEALALARELQAMLCHDIGTTWLYPADELYLLADEDIPPASFYQEPAQRENGVGLVRELLDDWAECRRQLEPGSARTGQTVTVVCGTAMAPMLESMAGELAGLTAVEVRVKAIPNRMFGEMVTVSGLLTAGDLFAELPSDRVGDLLVLPQIMFSPSEGQTLDDVSVETIAAHYGAPVRLAGLMSQVAALVKAR